MTKLTFIDVGVLIYAARGKSQIALKALDAWFFFWCHLPTENSIAGHQSDDLAALTGQ